MYRVLSTSKSGLNANQTKLDAISNNLANSNTVGYKRVEVDFKDLLTESLDRKGYPINDKTAVMGTGVRAAEWNRNDIQGNINVSELETDFALDGEGYFRVVDSKGNYAYTRDGAFKIDSLGRLVDGRGNKVYLEYSNGYTEDTVHLTRESLLVGSDGIVYKKENGTYVQVGKIPVYTALGSDAFKSIGDNLFVPSEGVQVEEATNTDILQFFTEGSNVDAAKEFTDMIVTQRAFQLSSKGITTADEMWGMINNMRS